jgi:F-type H+-transporting ATPase subunit b
MKIAFAIIGEAYAASETAPAQHGATGTEPAAAGTQGETHATTEAGQGAEGHGGGAFPPFDPASFASQLLWLAITFGIFYLLMSRLAIPRIAAIVETRKERIAQDLDEARRLKEEADAAHAAFEHEVAQARNAAAAIAGKARDEAKAKAEASRRKVEEEENAKLAEAESRIAAVKAKALKEVGAIASDTTGAIVRELLGANVTAAEITAALGGKKA